MNIIVKRFLLATIILILALIIFVAFSIAKVGGLLYDRPDKYLSQYYKEPENSLDGIVIGSSAAYRYWVGPRAYNQTGMSVYCFGSASTPIYVYDDIIESLLETQSPEFIAIEIRSLVKSLEVISTRHAWRRIVTWRRAFRQKRQLSKQVVNTGCNIRFHHTRYCYSRLFGFGYSKA